MAELNLLTIIYYCTHYTWYYNIEFYICSRIRELILYFTFVREAVAALSWSEGNFSTPKSVFMCLCFILYFYLHNAGSIVVVSTLYSRFLLCLSNFFLPCFTKLWWFLLINDWFGVFWIIVFFLEFLIWSEQKSH